MVQMSWGQKDIKLLLAVFVLKILVTKLI